MKAREIKIDAPGLTGEKIDMFREILRLSFSTRLASRFVVREGLRLTPALVAEVIRESARSYVSLDHANTIPGDEIIPELRMAAGRGVSLYCFVSDTVGCRRSAEFCDRLTQFGRIYDMAVYSVSPSGIRASVGDSRLTVIDRGNGMVEWSVNDDLGISADELAFAAAERVDVLPLSNALIRIQSV